MRIGNGLLAIMFLGPAVGCGQKAAQMRQGPDDRLPRLETVQPTRGLLAVRVELTAIVGALERAELCARVPGVVEVLPLDVDIGRRVKKGEELVRLAVPELEAQLKHKQALLEQSRRQKQQGEEALNVAAKELQEAEKQEKKYQANYTQSKDKHDRTTQLVQRSALQPEVAVETRSALESAQAAWQAAKAQIETRQAKLKAVAADLAVALSRIAVAEAEVTNFTALVGYATLRAPFDGVITRRWVHRGATIKDAGTPLLTVVHADTIRVFLDIPERHVSLVNALEKQPNANGQGDQVVLHLPALAGAPGGGEFTGTITRIAHALDPATRTMRAEVHLPNPKGELKPGMQGTATVLLEERSDVLTLPSSALVRQRNGVGVFIISNLTGDPPRGVVLRVPVELGLDDGRRVEIRKGLQGTEQVIAKGNGVIREKDIAIALPLREP